MKRKRRDLCPSPLLDEIPKRTKVHAQRKFAQGSNINSPVITPVQEFERSDRSNLNLIQEPVELLPIRRQNTEDFLTFLCFRGTPILPPNLSFFNTASIVDTNGQVHEIKSESPKNGPIDTSVIPKGGSCSSERPFIAFGVRKRADPIVISRQMERKRRHALALQALRRKYQEQKMAKIRAVTISKLSEKPSNRAIARTNSLLKLEKNAQNISAKSVTPKTKVKIIPSKTVNPQTIRNFSTKVKPRMCLRSFRGRFVQQELPFRAVKKNKLPEKKALKAALKQKREIKKNVKTPIEMKPKRKDTVREVDQSNVTKKSITTKSEENEVRVTRSTKVSLKQKINIKKTVIKNTVKRRILIPSSTLVKSRVLRSQTTKSNSVSKSRLTKKSLNRTIDKMPEKMKRKTCIDQRSKKPMKAEDLKSKTPVSDMKTNEKLKKKKPIVEEEKKESVQVTKSVTGMLHKDNGKSSAKSISEKPVLCKVSMIPDDKTSKQEIKADNKKGVEKQKNTGTNRDAETINIQPNILLKDANREKSAVKKNTVSRNNDKEVANIQVENINESKSVLKKNTLRKFNNDTDKSDIALEDVNEEKPGIKKNAANRKCIINKESTNRNIKLAPTQLEPASKGRPSRKTKEAAAIYMEILSHKLVEGSKVDDDTVSIDSFPELPNVKRTEQRENELKAKANISKTDKSNIVEEKLHNMEDSAISNDLSNINCIQQIEYKPSFVDIDSKEKDRKQSVKKTGGLADEISSVDTLQAVTVQKGKNEKQIAEISKKIGGNATCLEKIKVEYKADSKSDIKVKDEKNQTNVTDLVQEISKTTEQEQKKQTNKFEEKNQETCQIKSSKDSLKQKEIEMKKSKVKVTKGDATNGKSDEMKVLPVLSNNMQVFEQKIYKKLNSKDSSDSDECLAKIPRKTKLAHATKNKELFNKNVSATKEDIKKNNQIKTEEHSSDSENECLAKIKETKNTIEGAGRKKSSGESKTIKSGKSENFMNTNIRKKDLSCKSLKVSSTTKTNTNLDKTCGKSDVSSKSFKPVCLKSTKNKIISKEGNFSDSDEEPLSKLTVNKLCDKKSTEELKEDILRKQKALIESPPRNKGKKLQKHKEKEVSNTNKHEELPSKQKRECAKIPSNYLPMFSSSDDEEKFHGFSPKNEKKKGSLYSHSSLDFLSKGLGRRFGKEKVNMSNEQIEKWLKESAMAGDDSKKVEELKYCDEITPETSLNKDLSSLEQAKSPFLEPTGSADNKESTPKKRHNTLEDHLKSSLYKSPDRKPIFKKEKSRVAPTVGAFSANNESSIYAFEEEVEEAVSTPFRRPSRRPSSTATSKSEDELPKIEDQPKFGQFRKPVLKNELSKNEDQKLKEIESNLKQNQGSSSQKSSQKIPISRTASSKNIKKNSADQFDDFKYKIPSSPSASSSSSAKLYKKQNKNKPKPVENCNAVNMADFPCNGPGDLVEAPTFYPSEKEFQDPLEYIEKIGRTAEQFGICKIVPPNTFKPECKVSDDMRFTSYNQYVHKMLHRWGPNFKELIAIKKYLHTQNINLKQPPWIGGMEVDLPRLYQTVQSLGGLKEVIEKEKWSKVSDIMRIPKSAQDRVTKLDDIYCKYLLPYDTLSPDEREKLLDEVETAWAKKESKTLSKMQKLESAETENGSDSDSDNEVEECITKGRNMALNAFYRIARNTMSMWFKSSEPTVQDIEQEFWKHVVHRDNHICVHSGSIDSGSYGYGFAVTKNSPFARHSWNLKVLTNNSGSLLRALGPVMGVTVPTLHVGMVFSACCWYRDPHSLPWIEYLHTGGKKIWYGIPNSVGDKFQNALTKLVPNYCRNQGIWLPSDTVMLPPSLLTESGVPLSRIVQEPGEFIVVFPKAFTSSISTGYVVSESVFFAPLSWLKTAQMTFDLLKESCEPSMFSLERLYLSIINDQRTNIEVLKQMIPIVNSIHSKEKFKREKLQLLGVNKVESLPPPEASNSKRKKKTQDVGDYECEICRTNLFISSILEKQENVNYCLDHAIDQIEKKLIQPDNCKLLYTYSESDLEDLVSKINNTIEQKLQKKVFSKFSGMPTLLK